VNASATPLGAARQRERGQILVLFAFVLVSLLLISALAVDYGSWLVARRTYQNIADEAALAGAYQLTNPTGATCDSGGTLSKQQCARIAAWNSIDSHIGILAGLATTASNLSLIPINSLAVTWNGWKVWVASPPSDAGSDYPGQASSNKTVYVHVERTLANNLSRMVRPTTKVGAWATAGRIPENFAIIVLCRTGCLAGGQDLQVAGTGSNLVLESGDLASNSWAKTSGSGAQIALCEGSPSTSQCSAYMNQASNCAVGSVQCSLVGWNGVAVDSNQYSAIALPQVIDPQYTLPTLSDTRTGGVVSGTVPYQCYAAGDSVPGVSMVPSDQQFADGHIPLMLTAVQLPPTPAPVSLGAATSAGQVTSVVGGAKLNGITITLSPNSGSPNPATTSGNGANAGQYSIGSVAANTYTITAFDSTNTYATKATPGVAIGASGTVTTDFALNKNPSFSGTVKDSQTGTGISGAQVTYTGTGGPFTAMTDSSGNYTIYVSSTGTSYSRTVTATNYGPDGPYTESSGALDSATVTGRNFTLTPANGTITGTISGISPASGITITLSGAAAGSTTTDASGVYSFSVQPGTYAITPTVPSGYSSTPTSGSQTVTSNSTKTQNFVFSVVPTGTISGTVKDETTGLPLYNATVTITSSGGGGPWTVTTDSTGAFSQAGLTAGSPNPKYTVAASKTGWFDNANNGHANNQIVTTGGNTVESLKLWPDNCGTASKRGTWDCDMNSTGTGCTTVTDPTLGTVRCSAYDNTNAIRPGTYDKITIGNNECAWIDPLGERQGLTSGQKPGIVYVTDTLSIGSNAFLFGDGVTIVLAPGAHVDVSNSGGFVTNYEDTTVANQALYGNHAYRTQAYMGGQYEGGTAPIECPGGGDGTLNFKRSGWTTGGDAHVGRYTWDTSGATCYQDGDHGSYLTVNKGEIGIAWYLRGSPTCCGGHRFQFSGQMGFLFDGVLYGPKDDIDLGGQGNQAAAGQIVAYTLKFHGTTNIYQRWGGLETTGAPYLIEPYIGE
jgi:hypothetical protein